MIKKIRGFTLVELLVVISIIGVLVSVALVSFRTSQARGRDAQRKSDLKQISSALELYFSDYEQYPVSINWNGEFTDGKTVYFKLVPNDPTPDMTYYYRVVDPGVNQKYQLFAYLENSQDPSIITTNYDCGQENCNFAITSSNTTAAE